MRGVCRRLSGLCAALTFSAALAACSSTIHDEARIGGYDTLSIDAKQRLVIVGQNPETNQPMVCTEPSPDAIVAMSAALAAQGSATLPTEGGNNVFSGGAGFSRSESAASIAMRTASVQVLRDGYYRFCEAMMNGSISKTKYRQVIRGIGDFIATAMAIDAAAGMQHAPAVAISGGAINVATTPDSAKTEVAGASGAEDQNGARGLVIGTIKTGAPEDEQAKAIRDIAIRYLTHVERTAALQEAAE